MIGKPKSHLRVQNENRHSIGVATEGRRGGGDRDVLLSSRPSRASLTLNSRTSQTILDKSLRTRNNQLPAIMSSSFNQSSHSPSLLESSFGTDRIARCKDLNNFTPNQVFKFKEEATHIYTVENDITGETILAYIGPMSFQIYSLKSNESKNEGETDGVNQKLMFDIKKIQTVELNPNEIGLGAFTLGPDSCITLPPYKLLYAASPIDGKVIYVYCHKGNGHIEPKLGFNYDSIEEENSLVEKIETLYPVIKMAIDKEKFLGCILSNRTVGVWSLTSKEKIVVFRLKREGVHISWHYSDHHALMVVEAGGWIKFFNIYKEICYMTYNSSRAPLYCGDWALSNPLLTSIGGSGGFSVINSTQLNSNCYTSVETPQESISRVMFNPNDDRIVATLARVSGVVRLWKLNLNTNVWSFHNSELRDIAWINKGYLIALGFRSLYIFDGSGL